MASEEKEEQKNAWEKVEHKFVRYVWLCQTSFARHVDLVFDRATSDELEG